MSVLQVPLSSILEDGLSIEVETSGPDLRPPGAKDLSLGPVRVVGTLTPDGEGYIFTGQISGAFKGTCDRCLQPAEAGFQLDVYWFFIPEGDTNPPELGTCDSESEAEDDATCTTFAGNSIDLAPRVWEEIVLATPIKLLCAIDCAGLCPTCGANLNEGPCECSGRQKATTFTAKGLEGLKDMFPDLTSDRLED